jgi:hypothetical protein
MSTGLTYVYAWDKSLESLPAGGMICQEFPSYDEAVKFAIWNAKLLSAYSIAAAAVVFQIWTSGPNQNGYVDVQPTPIFNPFD